MQNSPRYHIFINTYNIILCLLISMQFSLIISLVWDKLMYISGKVCSLSSISLSNLRSQIYNYQVNNYDLSLL